MSSIDLSFQILNTSAFCLTALFTMVTALGVILAFWQIRLAKQQSVTEFEDSVEREYRNIIQNIPAKALLGESLSDEEYNKTFDEFIHYVDLTNSQIFMRMNKRISDQRWKYWCDGIAWNLSLPAFAKAWNEIKNRSQGQFVELRYLEAQKYNSDPLVWEKIPKDQSAIK